jgi:hypothetical protein
MLTPGVAPVQTQSVAETYDGYFVCLAWGRVNFTMDVTTPQPGWLTARLEYNATTPPPVLPKGSRVKVQTVSTRGSFELAGWLDDRTNRFKLDWQKWGLRERSPIFLLTTTFQISIVGTYRADKQTFDGMLKEAGCGTFVATRRGRKLEAPATEIPRPGEEQLAIRAYDALLDEVEVAHRDRALALPATTRSANGKSASMRCGAYFLYYDLNFMRKDAEHAYLFLPKEGFPGIGYVREWPPHSYTASYIPPDASVDWIDEVETVWYTIDSGIFGSASRGRRIPRRDVTPVPWSDSFFHRRARIKQRECGGTKYVW